MTFFCKGCGNYYQTAPYRYIECPRCHHPQPLTELEVSLMKQLCEARKKLAELTEVMGANKPR